MRIERAEFVKSAMYPDQWPRDRRPEIAFAGRSNVGKSTLLNVLLNRKGLAKTSKKPGKTQAINYFDINGKYYFVDLPGFGYAKVPKALREEWGETITQYLLQRETLRVVVHLLDARHAPNENDRELRELLLSAQITCLYVATKVDKLRAAELEEAIAGIREGMGIHPDTPVIPFSSISKAGLRELWNILDGCLRAPQK